MSKTVTITGPAGKPGQVYYPLSVNTVPKPSPQGSQVLIRLTAAALNHRDLFLRQHLYPAPSFTTPLLADGCGIVESVGPSARSSWIGQRVIINPGTGWKDDPAAPEDPTGYKIMGGTKVNPAGTLQNYLVIDEGELELAPAHLSDVEAAAFPLTGLTAWRAVMSKAGSRNVGPGANVLITGIGGGVALMALTYCVGLSANVWVTSGDEAKIQKATRLGAKGGVVYKEKDWEKELVKRLPEDRKVIDAVIDGAGGDIVEKGTRILKPGGVIVVYGMTVGPKMPFTMQTVLKHIDLKTSTMGSRQEFADMVSFVTSRKIQPVVSRSVGGIDNVEAIDDLFEDMKSGKQFGKLCIEIETDDKRQSKI